MSAFRSSLTAGLLGLAVCVSAQARVTRIVIDEVLPFAEPAGSPPPGFVAVEPNLEDAYFVLMRGEALEEAVR